MSDKSRSNRAAKSLVLIVPLLGAWPSCKKEQSSPPTPLPVGDTDIGNTNEDDCICGEMAELADDTTSAFVRDDPCIGVTSDHRNVVGALSRRRGATTVHIFYCDRFNWCLVRAPGSLTGFVHGSVLRRDRSADPSVERDE